MQYIISGTNRPHSNSSQVSKIIQNIQSELKENFEILDLSTLDTSSLNGTQYGGNIPPPISEWINKISTARSLIFVVPEYNGSMPGILKYFVDHWKFPDSFEYRPVAFVGLGGRFGGLRAVEHLQQVFGYRNSYIFPERVFLINCHHIIKEGNIADPSIMDLLRHQALLFNRFVKALESQELDARSMRRQKIKT